jgi:hypothetical protein
MNITGNEGRSLDETLEQIVNLLYLARHSLPGSDERNQYLQLAHETVEGERYAAIASNAATG